jgi:hypothetical protein
VVQNLFGISGRLLLWRHGRIRLQTERRFSLIDRQERVISYTSLTATFEVKNIRLYLNLMSALPVRNGIEETGWFPEIGLGLIHTFFDRLTVLLEGSFFPYLEVKTIDTHVVRHQSGLGRAVFPKGKHSVRGSGLRRA